MTYFGIASLIGMKGKLKLWTFCLETVALQYMVSKWRTSQIWLIIGGHVPGENSKNKIHGHESWVPCACERNVKETYNMNVVW